jgi:hypothetical protein
MRRADCDKALDALPRRCHSASCYGLLGRAAELRRRGCRRYADSADAIHRFLAALAEFPAHSHFSRTDASMCPALVDVAGDRH